MKLTKKHKGFTAIELVIVLGLLGLLIAALMPNLAPAGPAAKQQQIETQLNMARAAASKWLANTGACSTVSASEIDRIGAFDDATVNPWGGTYSFNCAAGGNLTMFTITTGSIADVSVGASLAQKYSRNGFGTATFANGTLTFTFQG